jgi:hypothetical protein
MQERVQQIGLAMRSRGRTLVAASQYRALMKMVDLLDV